MNIRRCLTVLIALCYSALLHADLTIPGAYTCQTATTAAGDWLIEYHITNDRLSYAVISGAGKHPMSGAVLSGGSAYGSGYKIWVNLQKPDGKKLPILDTGRIFQITGGRLTECPEQISGKEFKAFLDSGPKDYSVSALLDFVHQHRAK